MELSININGIAPVIMHCGQTADPLNHFAKAMKKCSGKRNKTQYRFRRRTASQSGLRQRASAANEKRRHEVGVSLLDVSGAGIQVSSSSFQLRFTCSLQLR